MQLLNEIEEAMAIFNDLNESFINSKAQEIQKQNQRDEDIRQIKEHTRFMKVSADAHTSQINQICTDLNNTKKQCDTVNVQLLQAQMDSQVRDKENAKSALIATILSIIAIVVGAAGVVIGFLALIKD